MVNDAGMMNETSHSDHTCGEPDSPAETSGLSGEIPGAAPGKQLSPEATRALLEAEERRKNAAPADLPPEINGRGGEEPTRYGDWERKGLAVDF